MAIGTRALIAVQASHFGVLDFDTRVDKTTLFLVTAIAANELRGRRKRFELHLEQGRWWAKEMVSKGDGEQKRW